MDIRYSLFITRVHTSPTRGDIRVFTALDSAMTNRLSSARREQRRCSTAARLAFTSLISAGELESFRDGKSRKITVASIRARVARKLAESRSEVASSGLPRGVGRAPPNNEAARQSGSTDARPGTSISSSPGKIVASAGRRKSGSATRSVARHSPSGKAIKAAMRFLAPWVS